MLRNKENDLDHGTLNSEKIKYQSYDIYNDQTYGYSAWRNYEDFRLGIFAISNAKPSQGNID